MHIKIDAYSISTCTSFLTWHDLLKHRRFKKELRDRRNNQGIGWQVHQARYNVDIPVELKSILRIMCFPCFLQGNIENAKLWPPGRSAFFLLKASSGDHEASWLVGPSDPLVNLSVLPEPFPWMNLHCTNSHLRMASSLPAPSSEPFQSMTPPKVGLYMALQCTLKVS